MAIPITSELLQRPDVFSRGALELTFRLLRPKQPTLALQVRNTLGHEEARLEEAPNIPIADHFYVDLEALEVGRIVSALTQLGQKALDEEHPEPGRLVVIKTLIREWMALGEWLIIQTGHAPVTAYQR